MLGAEKYHVSMYEAHVQVGMDTGAAVGMVTSSFINCDNMKRAKGGGTL